MVKLSKAAVAANLAKAKASRIAKAKDVMWKCGIKNASFDEDGIISIDGSINIKSAMVYSGKFLVKFGMVSGNFDCADVGLRYLDGAPHEVGGTFDCRSNKIASLKGGPVKVGGDYWCAKNLLHSLKGSPEVVPGLFSCYSNQIVNLKGCPVKVGKSFNCSSNSIASFEFAPEEVGGNFYATDNKNFFTVLDIAMHCVVNGDIILGI